MKQVLLKYRIVFIVALTMVTLIVGNKKDANAQDGHFSQYFASSLYLNPALVGAENFMTFRSNYRTQWRRVTLPYVTSQVSIILPVTTNVPGMPPRHEGGVGFSFYNDRAGDGNFKTLGMYASGAYTLQLSTRENHNILVFGLQGGVLQKQLDFTNLEWGAQYNPYLGFDPTMDPGEFTIQPTTINPDFNAGVLWFYNSEREFGQGKHNISAHSGIAISHLIPVNESLFDGQSQYLPVLVKYHGSIEFQLTNRIHLNGAMLAQMQNGGYEVNVGAYLNVDVTGNVYNPSLAHLNLITGLWYRYRDANIIMAGIENYFYTLGFSYDMNTSQLRTSSRGRGAFEISLAIRRLKEREKLKFSTPRI